MKIPAACMQDWFRNNVSFRARIGIGIAIAVVPLCVSALLHAVVVRSLAGGFEDVAGRHRDQLIPLQQLQADLLALDKSFDAFLQGNHPAQPSTYRTVRGQVESRFTRLHGVLTESDARALVDRAHQEWRAGDRLASRVLALPDQRIPVVNLGGQARTSITAAVDQLKAVEQVLTATVEREYGKTRRSAHRANWIAAFAAVVSMVSLMGGIAVVGHALSSSIDPLVDGAARFAAGERGHRIDVHAPRELHRVAETFNQLAVQLDENQVALAELARHDYLTGLLNRRALDEMLVDALARYERVNEGVAVVVIDVDLLKAINDTHGHFAGDEVLRLVSARLTQSIRDIDRAFRFGGEEFAVLLFNTDRESAEVAAERVRVAVAASPMTVNGVDIPVTISAGIATTDDSANAEGLLHAADAALYCAKSTGRNRVVWVGAMA